MTNPDPDLLSIGAFSRVTRLSQKALRLYGSLYLLPPAWVDPDSGYRYYRSAQVRDARLIRSLREVGMPLATIRRVLAGSPRQAQTLMRSYVTSLEEHARKARAALPDLYDWITTNGYEIDGSPRETWRHSFPLQGSPDIEISWKFIEVN
jgi:protein phosphatase